MSRPVAHTHYWSVQDDFRTEELLFARLRPSTGAEDLRSPINNLYFSIDIQAKGVQRIAVGIGKKINSDELETIAGSPDRVVNAESFDKLDKELDEIREVSCSKLFLLLSEGWSIITCDGR